MEIIKETSQELILEEKSGINTVIFRILCAIFYGLLYGLFTPAIVFFLWKFLSLWGITNINCKTREPTLVECELNRSKVGGLLKQKTQVLTNPTFINRSKGTGFFIITVKVDQIKLGDTYGNTFLIERLIDIKLGESYLLPVNPLAKFDERDFFDIPNFNLTIDSRFDSGLLILIASFLLILLISTLGFWEITLNIKKYNLRLTFRKKNNKLSSEKVGFLSIQKETHNLREISSIIMEESTDSDGDKYYTLILPVANQKYTLDSGYQVSAIQEKARKIANFLQVTVQNIVSL
jgi:hypothetical protein